MKLFLSTHFCRHILRYIEKQTAILFGRLRYITIYRNIDKPVVSIVNCRQITSD
jgi:hypothetical protein